MARPDLSPSQRPTPKVIIEELRVLVMEDPKASRDRIRAAEREFRRGFAPLSDGLILDTRMIW